MKITIYELLGMVKDGKAPEKIKYNNKIYFAKGNAIESFVEYFSDEDEWGFNHYVRYENLNKEVEIIEELKGIPEKLEILPDSEHYSNKVLYGKINEIIDYLKSKGDE